MKTALMVEDRDTGYLFLDPENAPKDAKPMAPGVLFADVEDDGKVVWLATDTAIRVVPRDSVDFENSTFEKEWPIPSGILCLTEADYEALINS